jgi:hypothetical protein
MPAMASSVEVGEWYSRGLAVDPLACATRHQRCSNEAQRAHAMMPGVEEAAAAIHAFLPRGAPCVALCTSVHGLLQVVGTATLLRDDGGPCLVTALHAICDRTGLYNSHYADHGLMALSMNNERLELGNRKWACYDSLDVAILPLDENEADRLGGAFDIAHAQVPAQLWIAYGFPQSSNKQKHLRRPFVLDCLRIVLYDSAPFPTASSIAPGASFTLRYDADQVFNPVTGKRQQARSPRGCSGGLVAGYHPEFGCWIPGGIVTEWHESDKALVATSLRSVFAAQ